MPSLGSGVLGRHLLALSQRIGPGEFHSLRNYVDRRRAPLDPLEGVGPFRGAQGPPARGAGRAPLHHRPRPRRRRLSGARHARRRGRLRAGDRRRRQSRAERRPRRSHDRASSPAASTSADRTSASTRCECSRRSSSARRWASSNATRAKVSGWWSSSPAPLPPMPGGAPNGSPIRRSPASASSPRRALRAAGWRSMRRTLTNFRAGWTEIAVGRSRARNADAVEAHT